jgi:hypothetical protein
LIDDLLPTIGPDLAIIMTDLDQTDKVPGELTLLLRLSNEKGKPMMEALAGKLYGWMQLTQGAEEAAKTTFSKDENSMTVCRKGEDYSPALIVTPTAVIASSSVETAKTMRGWLTAPPAGVVGSELPPFKGGLWGANLSALGQWLQRHSDFLARERARTEGVSAEEAKQWLTLMGETIADMDRFVAHGTTRPGAYEIVADLSLEP